MLVLGLDPGRTGGALLALDGRAVAAASWRPHTVQGARRYALVCAVLAAGRPATAQRGLPTPWAVGMALRAWVGPLALLHGGGRLHVAAEAAHVGRNARTGLALARWGGALVGPLEDLDPSKAGSWVEPDEWRRVVFPRQWWKATAEAAGHTASKGTTSKTGHPFMPKREAAKRCAAATLPGLVPGLEDVAALVGGAEHVLDAAGVARWRTVG